MNTSCILDSPDPRNYIVAMILSLKIHITTFLNRRGIFFFLFSVITCHAFPQDYNFRNFTSEDGLAQSYVYTIIQDKHGYLWVGTGNGVSRYNGFKFENYLNSDSSADNVVTCSISDGEYLWFGHMNGGLSCFDGKKFRKVNIPQSNISGLTHFAKSPDGMIWASTYSAGLLKLDKDSGVIKHNLFKDQTIVLSFEFIDESDVLVGTDTGLLYCRLKRSGEIEIIQHVSEIPESKITGVLKIKDKSGFYITTENDGVFKLTSNGNNFKASKITEGKGSDLSGLQDIYEDSLSNLWLSSFGNGLIKMSYSSAGVLTKINYFNKANGFITDNVKTIYEDREGNIWCGNYGLGLTLITPKTFSVYKFDNPLYGNNIISFCFDQKYRWIGTENGLLKMDRLTGKIVKFYGKSNGLPKDKVTSIYTTNGKELWIGTGENGVFRMDIGNERILKYPIENGVLENSITIITGKGEQVWIGTQKGLWNINSSTNRKNWYSINQGGLPHNFINSLYIDRTGKLWVSTPGSTLAYLQDEKVFKIPLNSPSGNLTLGPITEDTDSQIWVGSNGNGIFKIQSDSIVNLTVKEGLVSNYCYSLICDDYKNIWVGHKGGLSKIRTADFSIKPIQHIEGTLESYKFNPNAIIKDQQGKIWFGSDKGIVAYDPSMEYPRQQPPVLGITSIKINDEEKDISDKIILSPGNYKIRIDFLGISLKEPALVTYQYKLEGYDQWSDLVKNTSVTYNHLTEGDYTFILNARSGDGAVSEKPLNISIIIKKPIWMKWWFYVVTLLLLFVLTFLYIKRREYKFLVENRLLEEKVRERTYEIQCQKDEIEFQRDMIDEKNANITSSIKYASNIQKAVLPPIELIDKLLPDNFILSKPKDIVSGDFYWLAEKDNKIVFTVADCTGHGVPGAFMSLLGITLLNEIVNIQGITRSDAIVTELRYSLIHSLQQSRKDITTSDGLDIALCVLDQQQKRIQFTGAMNDLVYIRNGKINIVRADRDSVCALYENSIPFTMKEIDYRDGDVFYLFSDGYQDQFGGNNIKKFLTPHFHLTLLEIHKLPMLNQREILERKLNEWMKDEVQTDDITVMGIRL
ncbi:MAG: two-component regulator propeller domain-containing protein [Bacteroidales bacterium]|jgi:ligand-binding sensor domain-containing protein/serine phosphatase RsbU (regulator of sigma subunit)